MDIPKEFEAEVIAAIDLFKYHRGKTQDEIHSAARILGKHIDNYPKRIAKDGLGYTILDALVPAQSPRPGVVSFTGHRYDTLEWVVLACINDFGNVFSHEYKTAARTLANTTEELEWTRLAGVL